MVAEVAVTKPPRAFDDFKAAHRHLDVLRFIPRGSRAPPANPHVNPHEERSVWIPGADGWAVVRRVSPGRCFQELARRLLGGAPWTPATRTTPTARPKSHGPTNSRGPYLRGGGQGRARPAPGPPRQMIGVQFLL